MLHATMSNSTSLSEQGSVSSNIRLQEFNSLNPIFTTISHQQQQKIKKKRNLPGNPDPDAEVIALSPKTLMATNRYVCEICKKGFQRDQNLQLHRRGHNLPWKLRQRSSKEIRKRVYVCPEPSCIHNHPSRALGDLTGIKKHFCRKHGEKKWKCEKCSKKYAVQSDWKAHSKTCGTREYRCDCGTLFSRKDSFVTHRAFCDALAEESARLAATNPLADHPSLQLPQSTIPSPFFPNSTQDTPTSPRWAPSIPTDPCCIVNPESLLRTLNSNTSYTSPIPSFFRETSHSSQFHHKQVQQQQQQQPQMVKSSSSSSYRHGYPTSPALTPPQMLSSTAAAGCMGAAAAEGIGSHMISPGCMGFEAGNLAMWQKREQMTRDFLGVAGEAAAVMNVRDLLSFTGVDFAFDRDHKLTWREGCLGSGGVGRGSLLPLPEGHARPQQHS